MRSLSVQEFQVRQLAQNTLQQAIKEKATYWKQRSKEKHIRESDANTAFHHARASQRLRRNHIRMVRVGDHEIVGHAGKVEALTAYFKGIFGVPGESSPLDVSTLFAGSPSPSNELVKPFSEDEAKSALQLMNSNSAPGPDGFGSAFFRTA